MATIRMATSAGAALIVLTTIVAAASHAQAQKAPLQLVPGPDQAKSATRAATTKTAKTVAKTSNKATRSSGLQKERAAGRHSAGPAVVEDGTEQFQFEEDRQHRRRADARRPSNAQRARVENGQRARTVVASPRPIAHRAAAAPQIFAQGSEDAADNVMRDGDSVSLIGRLPWWRNDRLQDDPVRQRRGRERRDGSGRGLARRERP